jgi:hypothetical protein
MSTQTGTAKFRRILGAVAASLLVVALGANSALAGPPDEVTAFSFGAAALSVDSTSHRYAAERESGGCYAVLSINGVIVARQHTVAKMHPAAAGPQGAVIHCNRQTTYADADGTYTLIHKCGGPTAAWGYKISPALCSMIVGNLHEYGMMWARNGKTQGTQSPHTKYGCLDQVHGSYNPAKDNDHIAYSDVITFAVKGGHGQVQIYGSFTLSSNGGGSCIGVQGASSGIEAATVKPNC